MSSVPDVAKLSGVSTRLMSTPARAKQRSGTAIRVHLPVTAASGLATPTLLLIVFDMLALEFRG